MEDIGSADGLPVAAQRRVRLPSVERTRLRGVGNGCGIGRESIGIVGHAIVVGFAAECIGVDRKITAAGIEQRSAIDAVVDGGCGASRLERDARPRLGGGRRLRKSRNRRRYARQRRWNAVVGRLDNTADRLRPEAQGGGPADHLDLIGRQRIDRDRMILAEVRSAI